jgi:predicted amidohydrolase
MCVAAVQMTSTADKHINLQAAERLVRSAAADGARLIVLPEMFNVLGDPEVLRAGAEPVDGPTLSWAGGLARELQTWLVAGSIIESVPTLSTLHNTSCLVDPNGVVRAVYRKLHLFDADVPGSMMRESETVQAGNEIVTAEIDGARVGFSICYDLRFPELFRSLALIECRVLLVVSAFTERTGRDHWEVLVRARAIENQVFVVAADQVGQSSPRLRWHGRSMIVDPWGVIVAQAPDRPSHIIADLDFSTQDAVRTQLPCLRNRRPDVFQTGRPT